jgi:hypothetical protein
MEGDHILSTAPEKGTSGLVSLEEPVQLNNGFFGMVHHGFNGIVLVLLC